MKLACVVHRYGPEIAGGSEGHCRLIAEKLAAVHDVTVITTTAHDHVTWANHYSAGETHVGPVRVLRFPVERPRDLHRFRDISDRVFRYTAGADEEQQWFRENGPQAPALLDFLRRSGGDFDLVLFWAFRYYDAFFGVPIVGDRAILVPTAEDDPLIHVDALTPFFALPRGYLFLTPEEQALVGDRVPSAVPRRVIGCGIDPPRPVNASKLPQGVTPPYLLYLGRIDPNKGCDALFRYFARYSDSGRTHAHEIQLVLAGPVNMPVPDHPQIRRLGYVDEQTRDALLATAAALIVPSPYESLSMVLLEAWNRGVPAVVNARCAVLKGQVLRADGGLYYQNAMEFAGAVDYLLAHPDLAQTLGSQGRDYIEREYRWPTVLGKIESLLAEVRASSRRT
ncbi:MAG TPA: glycosyltransferase family 4 protein [Vicinamibacterales bacterium]